jgi:penicillin-binding protein 1A
MQSKAEAALRWVFENKVKEGSKAQAAIVVMSADGAVRAMVGGRKIEAAGSFNRATQALRQTGSSFKPFVYAAALDLGWSPEDYVDDSPLTINIAGSGPWSPKNYDEEFKGLVTLTEALKESRNIPAVRVSEAVGRELVRTVAEGFGIQSDLAAGPPYGLTELRLQGEEDPLMGAGGGIGERVISEQAAQLLTYMMSQVIEGGTGTRARLDGRPAAGKTGTTTAGRDAWFIGFTADYVTGVWMGYDDNKPLTGVTGGGLPAEIWHEVMTRISEDLPLTDLPMIIPEPRLPPEPVWDPNAIDPNAQTPIPDAQPRVPGAGTDPVESLLKQLLGIESN